MEPLASWTTLEQALETQKKYAEALASIRILIEKRNAAQFESRDADGVTRQIETIRLGLEELLASIQAITEKTEKLAGYRPRRPATRSIEKQLRKVQEQERQARAAYWAKQAAYEALAKEVEALNETQQGGDGGTAFEGSWLQRWSFGLLVGEDESQKAREELSTFRMARGQSEPTQNSFEAFLSGGEVGKVNSPIFTIPRGWTGPLPYTVYPLAGMIIATRIVARTAELDHYIQGSDPFAMYLRRPVNEGNTVAGIFTLFKRGQGKLYAQMPYWGKQAVPKDHFPWCKLDGSPKEGISYVELSGDLHQARFTYFEAQTPLTGNAEALLSEKDKAVGAFYTSAGKFLEDLFVHVMTEITEGRIRHATWRNLANTPDGEEFGQWEELNT